MARHLFLLRILQAVPTLLGVATLVFFLVHMVPGDPVDALLGETAMPADREALRQALHLDQPILTQFTHYFSGLAAGDWGKSLVDHRDVFDRIIERIPATAKLASISLLLALLLAMPVKEQPLEQWPVPCVEEGPGNKPRRSKMPNHRHRPMQPMRKLKTNLKRLLPHVWKEKDIRLNN